MAKALRDALARKNLRMTDRTRSKTAAWLEIAGGVALAIAAEPVHECGHAIAARLFTGAWPDVGFWAVHPTAPFASTGAVLGVLAAGDVAVIGWWALVLWLAYRKPSRKWMLIGPTFMTSIALLNWLAAALLAPFGRGDWGASDAMKFLAVSGLPWYAVAFGITAGLAAVSALALRVFADQAVDLADSTISPRASRS